MKYIIQASRLLLLAFLLCFFFSCHDNQIHSQEKKKELTPFEKLKPLNSFTMKLDVDTSNTKVIITPSKWRVPFCQSNENETTIAVAMNSSYKHINYDSLTNENTRNHYHIFKTLNVNKKYM
jgi:hypothetical protein